MAILSWMLKEWAIAVDALLAGDFILLIRKGGIREARPFFEVPNDRVLLFPTYEHQSADALRSPYSERFQDGPSPEANSPENVSLRGWAQITHQILLPGLSAVSPLRPFHIWTDAWVEERLAWQPDRPAYALLLKAYRFSAPVTIPNQKRYGGCRSWVTVDALRPLPEGVPVLSTDAYSQLAEKIQTAIATVVP